MADVGAPVAQRSPRGMLFRLVMWTVATIMRVVPRSLRAGTAFRASRLLLPIVRRLPDMAETARMHVEREEDTAFGMALRVMDRLEVGFDLRFHVKGEALLRDALRLETGTLLVGTHALTTQLIMRALCDEGIAFHLIAGADRYHIAGTTRWIPTIQTNAQMLVRARTALRQGEVVWALLDRGAPHPGRTTLVETRLGDVHVADALLRVAEATGARTLIMMSRMRDDGTVSVRYSLPPSGPHAPASELLKDYATAIIEHNAALAAR